MPVELRYLSARQLNALPKSKTVFFFPVGPLEDHGPHLPLGLDLAHARALCEAAASKLETDLPGWVGVIAPEAPLGVNTNTTETRLRVRAHVLRDWLIDACRSLKRSGFIHFVCFSGHLGPRQLTAIEEAGKTLMRASLWLPFLRRKGAVTFISATSASIKPGTVRSSPFWPDPPEHGGKEDTSLALHLTPEHVAEGYANLTIHASSSSFFSRTWKRAAGGLHGYWGAPAEASAEAGKKIISGTIDDLFPKMRAVWEGANPNALFRSWYSVLPPNKSLFRIWLLAFFLIVLLWIWAAYLMRGWAQ